MRFSLRCCVGRRISLPFDRFMPRSYRPVLSKNNLRIVSQKLKRTLKLIARINFPPSAGVERCVACQADCSPWSVTWGTLVRAAPLMSRLRCDRSLTHSLYTRRGLEAEAKKQLWTRIVTGSAPAQ